MSGEAEHVNDHVVVLEGILLAKIAVIFAIPEAACAHVETTIALLKNYHVRCELKIFVDLLQQFDNHFRCIVAPLLGLLRVVVARFELPKD